MNGRGDSRKGDKQLDLIGILQSFGQEASIDVSHKNNIHAQVAYVLVRLVILATNNPGETVQLKNVQTQWGQGGIYTIYVKAFLKKHAMHFCQVNEIALEKHRDDVSMIGTGNMFFVECGSEYNFGFVYMDYDVSVIRKHGNWSEFELLATPRIFDVFDIMSSQRVNYSQQLILYIMETIKIQLQTGIQKILFGKDKIPHKVEVYCPDLQQQLQDSKGVSTNDIVDSFIKNLKDCWKSLIYSSNPLRIRNAGLMPRNLDPFDVKPDGELGVVFENNDKKYLVTKAMVKDSALVFRVCVIEGDLLSMDDAPVDNIDDQVALCIIESLHRKQSLRSFSLIRGRGLTRELDVNSITTSVNSRDPSIKIKYIDEKTSDKRVILRFNVSMESDQEKSYHVMIDMHGTHYEGDTEVIPLSVMTHGIPRQYENRISTRVQMLRETIEEMANVFLDNADPGESKCYEMVNTVDYDISPYIRMCLLWNFTDDTFRMIESRISNESGDVSFIVRGKDDQYVIVDQMTSGYHAKYQVTKYDNASFLFIIEHEEGDETESMAESINSRVQRIEESVVLDEGSQSDADEQLTLGLDQINHEIGEIEEISMQDNAPEENLGIDSTELVNTKKENQDLKEKLTKLKDHIQILKDEAKKIVNELHMSVKGAKGNVDKIRKQMESLRSEKDALQINFELVEGRSQAYELYIKTVNNLYLKQIDTILSNIRDKDSSKRADARVRLKILHEDIKMDYENFPSPDEILMKYDETFFRGDNHDKIKHLQDLKSKINTEDNMRTFFETQKSELKDLIQKKLAQTQNDPVLHLQLQALDNLTDEISSNLSNEESGWEAYILIIKLRNYKWLFEVFIQQ